MGILNNVFQAIARSNVSILDLILVIVFYTLFVSFVTFIMFLRIWSSSKNLNNDTDTAKARETIKYLHTHNLTEDELNFYATFADMVDHESCCSWGMSKKDSLDLENECLCSTEHIKEINTKKPHELLKKS